MKNTISKQDAEQMAKRFYDYYDKIWQIVKEILKIQNSGYENDEITLNSYCIARHDHNVIVANYYSKYTHSYAKDIQFPLCYLYDENWQDEYKKKVREEQLKIEEQQKQYITERDFAEIERLKKLYPEKF